MQIQTRRLNKLWKNLKKENYKTYHINHSKKVTVQSHHLWDIPDTDNVGKLCSEVLSFK